MYDINYFQSNYPSIFEEMLVVEQDPIWHAEGSVGIHTEMVLETLQSLTEYKNLNEYEQSVLDYAAFFHDLGKLKTTKEDIDGRIVSPNHSRVGEKLFREIIYKNNLKSFEFREDVAMLIRYHGFPVHFFKKEKEEVVRLSFNIISNKLLYILCKADMLGRKSLSGDMDEILYQLEYFKEMAIEFECFEHPKAFSNARGRIHFCKTGEIYNPYVEEDFTVTLMVALPGSGKDYYIKNNLSHLEEISLDFFRRENKVKRGDKKREGRIIQKAKNKAKELLRNKQSFVWNATNLSSTIRKPLIDLFHQYKANVRIVYIEPEYKELLKQNNNREYPIPVTAINELIKKIDMPTLSEVEEIIYI